MRIRSFVGVLLLLPLVCTDNPIEAQTDEQSIRDRRAQSNAAIAAHDLDGIARAWLNDVHVVSSTSAQTAGSQGNQQRMAAQFKNRPDTIYVRTPTAIATSPTI